MKNFTSLFVVLIACSMLLTCAGYCSGVGKTKNHFEQTMEKQNMDNQVVNKACFEALSHKEAEPIGSVTIESYKLVALQHETTKVKFYPVNFYWKIDPVPVATNKLCKTDYGNDRPLTKPTIPART